VRDYRLRGHWQMTHRQMK